MLIALMLRKGLCRGPGSGCDDLCPVALNPALPRLMPVGFQRIRPACRPCPAAKPLEQRDCFRFRKVFAQRVSEIRPAHRPILGQTMPARVCFFGWFGGKGVIRGYGGKKGDGGKETVSVLSGGFRICPQDSGGHRGFLRNVADVCCLSLSVTGSFLTKTVLLTARFCRRFLLSIGGLDGSNDLLRRAARGNHCIKDGGRDHSWPIAAL